MTEDLVKNIKFKYKLLQYMKMSWKHTFKLLLLKYIHYFSYSFNRNMKAYSNADIIRCFVSPDQNSKHSKKFI